MRLDGFRKVLLALLAPLALLATPARALDNWEVGKTLHNAVTSFSTPDGRCTHCHAQKGSRTDQQVRDAIATVTAMNNLFAAGKPDALTDDQVTDIAAFLRNPSFPLASLTPLGSTTFAAVSAGRTSGPLLFRLANTGTATLTASSVDLSDSVNFVVDNPADCLSVGQGSSCDISVTFRPQSVSSPSSFSTSLTVNGLNTFDTSRSIGGLSGEGLRPFDVSATALAWPPSTEPTGALTTITDRKGDRIQVCKLAAASFSHPEDFSIDAPNALGVDGCFTSGTTTSLNRFFDLHIHFSPPPERVGKPSFATLRVQRVDGSGNPLAGTDVVNVALQGNPGALATVTETTLFDHVGDPGVEVDNDHFIDRSFTLSSEGSQPLAFTGSTFTLGGTFPGDYTVLNTGCPTLSGLAAADTPGGVTSCAVTLRFNPSDVGVRDARLTIQISGATDNRVDLNGTGFRGPRLAVLRNGMPVAAESLLEFGGQTVGGLFPPINVTLVNAGTQGTLGVALPAAGSIPGFSYVADPGCTALAAGAQCNLAFSFVPSSVGDASAHAVIRLSGGTDPLPDFGLNLHGQGVTFTVPVLSWTDGAGTPITRIDFPITDIGIPSQLTVRLSNAGPGGAALQFANTIGPDAGSFIIDPGTCTAGSTLFGGTSCQMTISFAPGAPGAKLASLQLATSTGQPSVLVLPPLLVASGTGRGVAAPGTLQMAPTALQFGDTQVGSQGLPQEVRLSNSGTHDLVVQALEATAPFTVQSRTCGSLPVVLRAGAECSVMVSFSPAAQGGASGTLRITTDASATPMELPLSANGTPAPDVSGGGCTLSRGRTLADPTLLLLLLGACVVLVVRRGRRGTS